MSDIDNYFREQDRFTADMIAAFDDGKLPEELLPYFQWKKGKDRLSIQQIDSMRYYLYEILDGDVEPSIEEYLYAIEAELDNIRMNYL